MPIFCERLKTLRNKNNLLQKQLAELLEVSERQYRSYEAGKVDPPTSKTIKLADYFGVSVDYLLGRTDNPEINK